MCFMPYPTKLKGGWQWPREVVVNKSTTQIREKKATRKFVNRYQDILQNNMAEGPKDPQGQFFYQEGGKMKRRSRDNASDEQSSNDEGNGRKCNLERPDQVFDDGVSGYRTSDPTHYTTTTKTQVTHIALQTDSCDTLYVAKNTLTAYTIAIVQNAQALQYDQMHVALQTARNQASLEMPLRVEELMTAHFNLVVSSNETDITKMPDAQKPEATILDAEPSASTGMRRPMLRYPVEVMLQIAIQRSNTLPEPSPQPVEESMDLLTEYRQVTRQMTLGTMILILMSVTTCTHTHTT